MALRQDKTILSDIIFSLSVNLEKIKSFKSTDIVKFERKKSRGSLC